MVAGGNSPTLDRIAMDQKRSRYLLRRSQTARQWEPCPVKTWVQGT